MVVVALVRMLSPPPQAEPAPAPLVVSLDTLHPSPACIGDTIDATATARWRTDAGGPIPAGSTVEYQGHKAGFDLRGNMTQGDLDSRTATKLVREWIDPHVDELRSDWELAQAGAEVRKIAPLE